MGTGYTIKCKKCRYKLEAMLGIGFGYPQLCEEILEKMKQGNFGIEIMEAAKSVRGGAVHQEKAIFICDSCGSLYIDSIIELCVPVGEKNSRSYVMDYELGENYKAVFRVEHRCKHCQSVLRAIKEEDIETSNIKCPKCSGDLAFFEDWCWD